MPSLKVVNVVASTRVAEDLNLPDIAVQLNCEYEPEQFPGVVYRVVKPKLAILMFRSGRAVCTGGKNFNDIQVGINQMLKDLRDAGIETWDDDQVKIEVQNMVATYALGVPLNLNQLTLSLAFDKVEYEPEQFPGLVYKLSDPATTFLLFSNGKLVCTGTKNRGQLDEAMKQLNKNVKAVLKRIKSKKRR